MTIWTLLSTDPTNGEDSVEIWEPVKRDTSCHNQMEDEYDDMYAGTSESNPKKEGEEDYEISYEENNYIEQ